MEHLQKKFEIIFSIRLLFLILTSTVFFFYFIDIPLFKFTRSMHGLLFDFFNKIVDPFSDIVDPGNIILLSGIVWLIIRSIKNILKEPKKQMILCEKLGFKKAFIIETMEYYLLIIKHIFLSIIVSGIILHVLKYILGVSRPKYFFLEGYVRQSFFNLEHRVNSLPSGHTQAAFTIAVLFILYVNRYNGLIIAIACLLGISRIFMNAHFPSDLILGAYIGSFFPVILYKIYFLEKFRKLKKEKIFHFKIFLKLLYLRLML